MLALWIGTMQTARALSPVVHDLGRAVLWRNDDFAFCRSERLCERRRRRSIARSVLRIFAKDRRRLVNLSWQRWPKNFFAFGHGFVPGSSVHRSLHAAFSNDFC